jgi:hypothetical protein
MENKKVKYFNEIESIIGKELMIRTNRSIKAKLADFTFLLNAIFNLFSLSQSITKGLKLGRYSEGLRFKKG